MVHLKEDYSRLEEPRRKRHKRRHRTLSKPKRKPQTILNEEYQSNKKQEKLKMTRRRTVKPSSSFGLWDKDKVVNLSHVYLDTNKKRLNSHKLCGEGWQEEYAVMHDEILKSIRPRKFLVYSCKGKGYGCAGYGNRIGGISSLFFLAVLTKRAFLIDWNDPAPLALENFLWPKRIKWNYAVANLRGLESRTHYWGKGLPKKLQHEDFEKPGNLYPDFAHWFRIVDFNSYFDRPVEVITATWNFAQEIWSNPYLSQLADEMGIILPPLKYLLVGCSYEFLFQRSPELENRLSKIKNASFAESTPIIGLHIRMGDVAFGRKRRLNTQNFKSFFTCAQVVEKSIAKSNPNLKTSNIKWFLATDHIAVKEYGLQQYPGKVLTLDVEPEHIGIFQKQRFPTYEGVTGVFLDHFLLAECFFLILSNSTFGTSALGINYHGMNSFTFGESCGIVKHRLKKIH